MDNITQLLIAKLGINPAAARSLAARIFLDNSAQANQVKAAAGVPPSPQHPIVQLLTTKYGIHPEIAKQVAGRVLGGIAQGAEATINPMMAQMLGPPQPAQVGLDV